MFVFLTSLRYSFAVQLLAVHLKKNVSLLFIWFIIFGVATSNLGVSYGAPYTILDPEYMGRVNFWSFWWIGLTFGFFITAWHLSCYMLNSFRFPFLATSRRPFLHFCINNSVIPLSFVITYIIAVTNFQIHNEFTSVWLIPLYILGFLSGLVFICLLFGIYFHYTNHDIKNGSHFLSVFGYKQPIIDSVKQNNDSLRKVPDWEQPYRNPKIERVDNYINAKFKIRPTRSTEHYAEASLNAIFQQHHANALLVQVAAMIIMMFLGFAADIPFFQIPAAASILLLLVIIVSLMGAFTYWLTAWRTVGIIVVFMIMNNSARIGFLNYNTPAFGLNYDTIPAIYSDTLIKRPITQAKLEADRAYMLPVLENWKRKAQIAQGLSPAEKPVMVLLNFSGGGLRSMLWSNVVVQEIDSLLDGRLLDHTFMMAGASGGVLGAAYLRQRYYNETYGKPIEQRQQPNEADKIRFLDNASKDYLNAIFFTGATNDLFIPLRTFSTNGYTYRRTRAYAFERQYHENTDSIIANKTIADYAEPERNADMPLLFVTPTIVSNSKKIIISPHPVSYLCRPSNSLNFEHSSVETDGIELSYFNVQDGYNMLLSSAIRISATYPFILPDTYLPLKPDMQVMDAGFRDNHGFETTFRLLLNFAPWIDNNVSEVVMVFVRSDEKDEVLSYPKQTYIERYLKPIQSFIGTDMQDFSLDLSAAAVDEALAGKLSIIDLEYIPNDKEQRAAMSFHLTTKEKHDLRQAIYAPKNKQYTRQLSDKLKRKTQATAATQDLKKP